MHLRLSTLIGIPVLEEGKRETLGAVSGVLVHPDTGKIEGFFVSNSGVFSTNLFFPSSDIAHLGHHKITLHDADSIAPLSERVRLWELWQEGRPVMGQRMVTQSGRRLGRCSDIQFDSEVFTLQWLFPRRWFFWKDPIPVSAIVEVRY